MAGDVDSLGLRLGAASLVRDLVHERTGLYYDDGRLAQMADRLAALLVARGFDSFLDYYYFLKYDAGAADEWAAVMDALAVPETYFWREADQLQAVVDVLVPSLARRLARPVRIWSVPCASGEEPLTLAMMFDQRGWPNPVVLEGSDASRAALDRAAAGIYRERAFRSLAPALRQQYFRQHAGGWRIDPALASRVTWSRVNLLDTADVAQRAAADVILCRNVFIYFSQAAIRTVVDTFARAMPVPAYLCVGAAESLLRVTDRFELEQVGDAFVYAKKVTGKDAIG